MSGLYQVHKLTTDLTFDLLKLIAKGGALPFKLLYSRLKKHHPELQEHQLRARLEYYKQTQVLYGSAAAGYNLYEKGVEKLNALKLSRLRQTEKWDGKWRLIAFDIPEDKRTARDALRRLIKQLGCRQLQRSLWVHPLPCLEQFQIIQEAYEIKEHIVLIETAWIDNQENLLRAFRESYPNL